MGDSCHTHVDREAVALCKYCGRKLCSECLTTSKGYSFCTDSDDCLEFQNKDAQSESSSHKRDLDLIKDPDVLLRQYVKRLSEVTEELDEISPLFSESASDVSQVSNDEEIHKKIVETSNRLRIPGFRAVHLAQEGIALLNLIWVTIRYMERTQQVTGTERQAWIENIIKSADEAEPFFHETLKDMAKYKSLDVKETLEAIFSKSDSSRVE